MHIGIFVKLLTSQIIKSRYVPIKHLTPLGHTMLMLMLMLILKRDSYSKLLTQPDFMHVLLRAPGDIERFVST